MASRKTNRLKLSDVTPAGEIQSSSLTGQLVVGFCLTIFLTVLVRVAWLSDDAYITLRSISNLFEGYGLRYNVTERVQSFTHPLWLLLVLPFYTLFNGFFALHLVSIAASLFTVFLLLKRHCISSAHRVAAVVVLVSSKAFIDYSSSGLENPLTHLLVAAFLLVSLRPPDPKTVLTSTGLFGLILLNRMDAGLLVLPLWLGLLWQQRTIGPRRLCSLLATGLTPFLIWEIFATIYYGFPFPNTAYAKLAHGIPRTDLLRQGVSYYLDSLDRDPTTLIIILMAIGAGRAIPDPRLRLATLGLLLYCFYILWIGGDFMSGRFFSAPFLFAIIILVHAVPPRTLQVPWGMGAVALLLILSLAQPHSPLRSTSAYGNQAAAVQVHTGIADERAFYYEGTGLMMYRRGFKLPANVLVEKGMAMNNSNVRIQEVMATGFVGYYAGPGVHIVDVYGLVDPLLSRLAATGSRTGNWRIGHFDRKIPTGYYDALLNGTPLADKQLEMYYRPLQLIVSGPVWSATRWIEIFRFNLRLVRPPAEYQ